MPTNMKSLLLLTAFSAVRAQSINLSGFNLTQYAEPLYCQVFYNCPFSWGSNEGQACVDAWCKTPFGGSCDDSNVAKKKCCDAGNIPQCFESAHPHRVNEPNVGSIVASAISPTNSAEFSSLSSQFQPCATIGSLVSKCAVNFVTGQPTQLPSDQVVECACYNQGKYDPDVFDKAAASCAKVVTGAVSVSGIDWAQVTDFCKNHSATGTAAANAASKTGESSGSIAAGSSATGSPASGSKSSSTGTATGSAVSTTTTGSSGASSLAIELSMVIMAGFFAYLAVM